MLHRLTMRTGAIVRADRDAQTVGRKGAGEHRPRRLLRRADDARAVALHIPQPRRVIRAAGQDAAPSGLKQHSRTVSL